MVKKSVPKKKRNAPVVQKPIQSQPAPMISNEQYMLNVMTTRCKTLETQVIQLAQEVARLKTKYEPTADELKKGGA